jgi:hypothetical protein
MFLAAALERRSRLEKKINTKDTPKYFESF